MATSPRGELRIVSITEFKQNERTGQWYWTTLASNGEPVGDGAEGYIELRKAVSGFLAQQGFSADVLVALGDDNPFSKMVRVSATEYHIRKYAYGAPDPYDPKHPAVLAIKGWQPEGVAE